jgi:hypothetical protein
MTRPTENTETVPTPAGGTTSYKGPTITISMERYSDLVQAERMYEELDAAGVDNWQGYAECYVMSDKAEIEEYVAEAAKRDAVEGEP